MAETFRQWWDRIGFSLDPEAGVPWFDKREEFAMMAYDAGQQSCNSPPAPAESDEPMTLAEAIEIYDSGKYPPGKAVVVMNVIVNAARARLVGAEDGWLPIESAPKDGTSILAVVQGQHPARSVPYIPCVTYWDEGWVTCETCDIAETDCDMAYQPTHWRPLHAPPAQAGEVRG